jgi:hypothetical protein
LWINTIYGRSDLIVKNPNLRGVNLEEDFALGSGR